MGGFEQKLAIVALIATAIKALTSAIKDIHDMQKPKQKKRRTPAKKKRRK